MLHEVSNVKQESQTQNRRWFTDSNMDLFIWFENQAPVGFQLSYNKQGNEKAMCWENKAGFRHYRVDSGEADPTKYKMTPLYSPDDSFDTYGISRAFLHSSDHIEVTLADFIYARLLEYPSANEKHSNQDVASDNF